MSQMHTTGPPQVASWKGGVFSRKPLEPGHMHTASLAYLPIEKMAAAAEDSTLM